MTLHYLPAQRRVYAFVFPLIVVLLAGMTTPTFIEAGLLWWPLFIFSLPMLLAMVMALEYWNVAIGLNETGVHYRSVGYTVSAPWHRVSERSEGRKISLHVDRCEPQYHWWLGMMQAVLRALTPGRARYAHGLMSIIPLWWFSHGPDDTVMTEYAMRCSDRQKMNEAGD